MRFQCQGEMGGARDIKQVLQFPTPQRMAVGYTCPVILVADTLAVLVLLTSPGLYHSVLDIDAVGMVVGGYSAAAYCVGRGLLANAHLRTTFASLVAWAVITAAVVAPGITTVLMFRVDFSRGALITSILLIGALMLIVGGSLSLTQRTQQRSMIAIAALVLLVLIGQSVRKTYSSIKVADIPPPVDARPLEADVGTISYALGHGHDLQITTLALFAPPHTRGGGIEQLDSDTILIATGDGAMYRFSLATRTTELLELTIPIDRAGYLADNAAEAGTKYFRATDILIHGDRILASYMHWNGECATMRLAEGELVRPNWIVRYETAPCLERRWSSYSTGGRLASLNDGSVLLTVGSHQFEGIVRKDLVSDPATSYGKIIRLEPAADWRASTFTTGHRNPQGLLVTSDSIWSTEHGPKGGDEFNRIEEGNHYGWPLETYGTDYASHVWPRTERQDHGRYTEPVYAWVPSIGVSNLIQLNGQEFPRWKGDFLIGSLSGNRSRGKRLFRVRVRNDKAMFVEPLETGEQVRDLVQLQDGRVLVWTGDGKLQLIEQTQSEALTFATCWACHETKVGAHGIGPDLFEIVDRPIGARSGFNYSSALVGEQGTWTEARLDSFLRDPAADMPGNNMEFGGIADEQERKALIGYLKGIR